MGQLVAGAVAVLPFPFSDLSRTRRRPALVLAEYSRGDLITCQITRNPYGDEWAITLDYDSFDSGSLDDVSYARPGKLFTVSADLVIRQAGILNAIVFNKLIDALVRLLNDHRIPTQGEEPPNGR